MGNNILEILPNAISNIISTMTPDVEEGGIPYLLDWTNSTMLESIEEDHSKVLASRYPVYSILHTDEAVVASSAVNETNELEVSIFVVPNKGAVSLATYDKAVRDIKKLVNLNASVAGCFFWQRTSIRKFYDPLNIKNIGFRFNTKIKYLQYRNDP